MHTRRHQAALQENTSSFRAGMDENAAAGGGKPSELGGGGKSGLGGAAKKGLGGVGGGGVQTRRGLRDITNNKPDEATAGHGEGGSKGGKKPGARVASASVGSVVEGDEAGRTVEAAATATTAAAAGASARAAEAGQELAIASGRASCAATTAASSRPIRTAARVATDIDLRDADEPLAVTEYVEDLYMFLREREIATQIDRRYMESQPNVNERMRSILVDWLVEVHLKFKLVPDTLYLTVYLIDKYLEAEEVRGCNVHRPRRYDADQV